MTVATRLRYGAVVTRALGQAAGLELQARVRRRPPAAAVPRTHADPLGADVLAAPEAWYRDLHATGPVHYHAGRDLWVVSGYDAVRAAARADAELSSADGITPFRMRIPMLVATDRPAHARLRRILARDFTRRRVLELRPTVDATVADLCAPLAAAPGDAYDQLAAPLPLAVIAHVLGVPGADRAALRRWSDAVVEGFHLTPSARGAIGAGQLIREVADMFAYFGDVITARRADPQGDALSRLAGYDDEDGRLTDEELLWFTQLLLVAGNETTTSLITALLFQLGSRPELLARLRADPALAAPMVEEGLRWASPIPGMFRTAVRPHAVGDVTIPAGARVLLSFGGANRDPRRFPEPDRFDPDRDLAEHLAFGSGIHFCLGAHLARMEATAVLEHVAERFERVELCGPARWRHHPSLRGIESLPVRFR